jgi:hypothetical protein
MCLARIESGGQPRLMLMVPRFSRCHQHLLWVVLCTVLLFPGGCGRLARTSDAVTVDVRMAPEVAQVGRGTVAVNLRDSASQLVTGAHVTAEGNMTHPGMAPVFVDCKETEPGRYQADLNLGMRGSWVVLLHIQLANGEKLERQVGVKVKAD